MRDIRLFMTLPLKNKLLVIVLLTYYPVVKLADLLSWLSERLYDVGYAILKWSEREEV